MATTAREARMRLGPQTAFALETGKQTETFIDMTLCNALANSTFPYLYSYKLLKINELSHLRRKWSERSERASKSYYRTRCTEKFKGFGHYLRANQRSPEAMCHYDVQSSEWNNI